MSVISEQQGEEAVEATSIRFFRASDAEGMRNAQGRGAMRRDYVPHPAVETGMKKLSAAGFGNGAIARILFSSPTMHIGYAWFKSGFPLPLHSHDADCFYQVIAGSMRVGTEELGKGDGVLIPAGAPYTVTPGPEGVEILEFRTTHDYDTRYRGKTARYWDRLAEIASDRQAAWAKEDAPFDLLGLR